MQVIIRFLKGSCGATTPEYVLIAGLVVLVCVGTLQSLGSAMNTTFSQLSPVMGKGTPPASVPPSAQDHP